MNLYKFKYRKHKIHYLFAYNTMHAKYIYENKFKCNDNDYELEIIPITYGTIITNNSESCVSHESVLDFIASHRDKINYNTKFINAKLFTSGLKTMHYSLQDVNEFFETFKNTSIINYSKGFDDNIINAVYYIDL